MARDKETFVARVRQRRGDGGVIGTDFESDPKTSVASAMATVDAKCKAGRYAVVTSNYTSDGTHHPGHRGRVMATCERKRWFVETFPPGDGGDPSGRIPNDKRRLSGARRRRRARNAKACPVSMGAKRAPKGMIPRRRGAR